MSTSNEKKMKTLICGVVLFLFVTYILYNSSVQYDFRSRFCHPEPKKSEKVHFIYDNKSWVNIDTYIKKGIAQNDSRILDYIKKNHLTPPSALPYRLSAPNVDPGSQIGQNAVVKRILKNMRNGFFVDAGAHDGEYISNTLALERDFGWTGLLVECSPIELPNLRSKHRKAWIANVCLSPVPFPSTFEYLHRIGYTIASKLKDNQRDKNLGKEWKLYRLQCFPIFSLLSALGVKTVDYFSLDVEGVELKVLNTIPFDSVFIKVISIEFNLIPEGKLALKSFMESKEYELAATVYHDYIFVHKSLNYTRPTTPLPKSTTTKATTTESAATENKM